MSTDIVATSQNIENIMSMLTKLENIRFYGFNEIFSSTDKIKNDSYRPKVTFDFSEEGEKVEEIYFKLTPNDVEKKY